MNLTESERELIVALREKQKVESSLVPDRPPCVWLYVRYSHVDSGESGLTTAVQGAQVVEYAAALQKRRGTSLPVIGPLVDEAVSARKVRFCNRKQARLIWQAARNGDILIIARLDRAFRSVADMSDSVNRLMKRGVEIHFVRENIAFEQAHGKLLAHVLAAVAQWHSDVLSERNKEIAAELRSRGRPLGSPRVWERYVGKKGSKIRVSDPLVWQDCITVYVLSQRSDWTWIMISDFMEALCASREGREFIPRDMDLARKWSRRRCWAAYKAIEHYARGRSEVKQQLASLVKGNTPIDQVGRMVPPPDVTPEHYDPRDAR